MLFLRTGRTVNCCGLTATPKLLSFFFKDGFDQVLVLVYMLVRVHCYYADDSVV